MRNRTGDVWHVWVEGIRHGQLYANRVDGPYQPKAGHRFNFHKLLLDPFATATIERGLEIAELLAGSSGCYLYSEAVSAARALTTDYTARVIPHCEGVAIPLEEAHIL